LICLARRILEDGLKSNRPASQLIGQRWERVAGLDCPEDSPVDTSHSAVLLQLNLVNLAVGTHNKGSDGFNTA